MASTSRHQSRLAREMARDLGRTDHSVASSTGSHHGSVSSDDSWDPENEAECSTGRRFPELRDTAKKYGKWNSASADKDNNTDNYFLDTSAIGRAFPDFTQGMDSDMSSVLSVEDGRGAKPGVRQRVPSNRIARQEYSDNVDAVVNVSNYRIMGTPPLGDTKVNGKQSNRQQALRADAKGMNNKMASTPQKENVAPAAPPSSGRRQKNYISGATRTASGEHRRTLAELQAGVADDSDGSFISDERPATVTLTKSSRFAQPRASPLAKMQSVPKPTLSNTLATKRPLNRDTPKKALSDTKLQPSRNEQFRSDLQRSPSPPTRFGSLRKTPSSNNQTTEQSFLIPNVDAFSVLGSGSPGASRGVAGSSSLANHSRFAGGSGKAGGAGHNHIDSVPVPSDEKAIFLSLQLLQDKVSSMEAQKLVDAKLIKDLEERHYKLEMQNQVLERRRRSDSALGDSGSEAEQRNRKLLEVQKQDLEAKIDDQRKSIASLQRTATEKDSVLQQVAEDRDSVVSQLEEAWKQQDRLEQENLDLRRDNAQLKREQIDLVQENSQMKAQLARLGKETDENTRHWNRKEQEFRTQLKEIVAVPDLALREENANLRTHLTHINNEFGKVQRQLEQLNKALSKETARCADLENTTRHFNLKEADLLQKLQDEVDRRTEAENAARLKDDKEDNLRAKLLDSMKRSSELENKTLEFMSRKETDLRAKLEEEIKRRIELESTTRQALIKENEIRDKLDHEINHRANLENTTRQAQNNLEQTIREEVTREFQLKEKELTEKIARREKAIKKVRGLMSEITECHLPPTRSGRDAYIRRQRSASQPQPMPAVRDATVTSQKEAFTVDFEDFSIPPMSKAVAETDDDDASDDGSFALDTTQTIHKDINVTKEQDTSSTNFSDVCGPGVMQAMRDGVAYARFRKTEIDAGRPDPEEGKNDTMASVKSGRSVRSARSIQSVRGPVGILKRGETDDTRQSVMSQKSARDNDTVRSTTSQRSHGRRHSVPVITTKNTSAKANATIDLTSAYLVPDITLGAGPAASTRAEPLSESAKAVFNKLCRHDSGNCTMCSRIATLDNNGQRVKPTVKVTKPIPVSSRNLGPDATLRPTVPPGRALAIVFKAVEDELAHLCLRHEHFQRHYFNLDAGQERRKAKALEEKLTQTLKEIKSKRAQIYTLADVLEGQKMSGQEMTQSEIDVTLTGLGLDSELYFFEKGAKKEDTPTGNYFDELDLSWAGIEESTQ